MQTLLTATQSQSFLKNKWVRRSLGTTAGLAIAATAGYSYYYSEPSLAAWYFGKMNRGEIGTTMTNEIPTENGLFAQRAGYAYVDPFRKNFGKKEGNELSPQRYYPVHNILGLQLHLQYEKKQQTGISILDDQKLPLYAQSYPKQVASGFDDIASEIYANLCFVEDQSVCDPALPATYNPGFDLPRVIMAGIQSIPGVPGSSGGSTIPNQYSKFMQSPNGQSIDAVTGERSPIEKARQWGSSSRDAYAAGPDTRAYRKKIILDYMNAAPFAAAPGWGEVHGIADAMQAHYGTSLEHTNHLLSRPFKDLDEAGKKEFVTAYRQTLSLIFSLRMGTRYMSTNAGYESLQDRIDTYIPHMIREGRISAELGSMLQANRLKYEDLHKRSPLLVTPDIKPRHKAVDAVRIEAAEMLGIDMKKPGVMYEMDKFDLDVETTLDKKANDEIRERLHKLYDPEFAKAMGILGDKLANPALLNDIVLSFVWYKAGTNTNDKIIQVDTNPGWLDIAQGTQLQMGSTWKPIFMTAVKTDIHKLHAKYAAMSPKELTAELAKGGRGPFTKWTIEHLLKPDSDKSADGIQAAFMQKRYSANPNVLFFTGGGLHKFKNYRPEDNGGNPTMQEALEKSINLPFIHMLMDHIKEIQIEQMGVNADIFDNVNNPQRVIYVERNAHTEGLKHLERYWNRFKGKSPEQIADDLVSGARKKGAQGGRTPAQAAVIFRSIFPDASYSDFEAFVERNKIKTTPKTDLRKVYDSYSPDKFTIERKRDPKGQINYLSLMDRGYVASMNELALVVAHYQANTSPQAHEIKTLKRYIDNINPADPLREELVLKLKEAEEKRWDRDSWKDMVAKTSAERLASAEWLVSPRTKVNKQTGEVTIRPGIKKAQDKAIRIELEREAFIDYIHPHLKAMGYPFPANNPSAAWILGGAGNTTASLSTYLGMIQHDGLMMDNRTILRMEGAKGIDTFNWVGKVNGKKPTQAIPVEVARSMRAGLEGVAERGTFRSIQKSLEDPAPLVNGKPVAPDVLRYTVGGKTGTSYNVEYTFGPGGSKKAARAKSLTSTAMIMATDNQTGERYFGTVMAYVEGEKASKHHFTSALALRIWANVLAPVIKEHMETPAHDKIMQQANPAPQIETPRQKTEKQTQQILVPEFLTPKTEGRPNSVVRLPERRQESTVLAEPFNLSALLDYDTGTWYLTRGKNEFVKPHSANDLRKGPAFK